MNKCKMATAGAGLMLAMFMMTASHAGDGIWSVDADGNWSTTTNWSGGTVADGADFTASFTVNITVARIVTLDTARTIGNITFTDSTTSSHDLTISGPNVLTLSVSTGNPVINVTQSGRTLTISSVIDGTSGLTKSGAGNLTLSGANTFSGGTTLNAGVVNISNAASFGASTGSVSIAGAVSINATGALTYANAIAVNAALTLKNPAATLSTATFSGVLSGSNSISLPNTGTSGVQGIVYFTNTANTFTGNVILSASSAGDEHFKFNSIGDGGNFTFAKNGNRQLITYAGTSDVTFNTRQIIIATTMFNGGSTDRQGMDGGGSNPVSLFANDGSGTVTFTANMVVNNISSSYGVLFFGGTNTGNNTFGGNISDTSGSTKLCIGKFGAGKWIFSGSNTYEGNTLVGGGTLSVGTIADAGVAQPLGIGAGVQLGVGNSGASGTLAYTGGAASTTKQIVIGSPANANAQAAAGSVLNNGTGALTFTNTSFNIPSTSYVNPGTGLVVSGAVSVSRTLTLGGSYTGGINEIQGAIVNNNGTTGPVALTFSGGTWRLSGPNTYTGLTTVSAGTLQLGNAAALGSTTGTTTVSSGATLDLNGQTTAETLAISGTGVGANGALINSSGTAAAVTGTITGGFTAGGTGDMTLSLVTGNASFTKIGTGTVTLGGTADNNSRPVTNVSEGILILGKASTAANHACTNAAIASGGTIRLGGTGDNQIFGGGTLTVNSGGLLDLNGKNQNYSTSTFSQAANLNLNGTGISSGGALINNMATLSTITMGSGTVVLQSSSSIGGTGDITIVGVISESGGAQNLSKVGTGNLTLSGVNTYSGATNVNAGTLTIASSGSLTVSASTVSSSAAMIVNGTAQAVLVQNSSVATPAISGSLLRGTGNVGSVTFNDAANGNAVIWPGVASRVDTISANESTTPLTASTVNFSSGGKLAVVLKDNGGLPIWQKLVVSGSCTIPASGAALSFATDTATFGVPSASTYLVIKNTSKSIDRTFPTIIAPPNAMLGTHYDIKYVDSTNPGTNTALQSLLGNGMALVDGNSTPFTADEVYIVFTGTSTGVTPVKSADFAAKSEAAGVNVSWTCVSEYQNAGFNIYRRAFGNNEWVKVNPTLIAGRITNPDERKYAFYDWAHPGMYEYKLESIDLTGGREVYEKISDVVDVDWNPAFAPVTTASIAIVDSAVRSIDMASGALTAQHVEAMFAAERNSPAMKTATVVDNSEAGNKIAVREIAARSENISSAASNSLVQTSIVGVRWFSSGRTSVSSNYTAAKVSYRNAGVMLIPQSSMPEGFDLGSVTLQREGRNMNALAKVPAGLLVYAPGYKDNYTDKDALFLRKTANPTNFRTTNSATGLFSSAMPVNVKSPNTITNTYHDVYFDYNLRPYSFEPWFSNKYLTQGSSQDFNINLTDVVSGPATLVVNLWSLTSSDTINPDHSIQVLVNGQVVSEASWDGGNKMLQMSFTAPTGTLKTGANVVSLVTPTLAGQDSQIAFLHSISVNYTRGLDGSKPFEIINTSETAALYELYNVSTSGAWVVDARFSDRASLVPTETQVQSNGTLRLRFVAQSGGSGKFLVVPAGMENTPLQVSVRQVKALKLNGTYLATGPAQFSPGTQPLLMKRAKEGIRGTYIDQEQLFDYYNHGRFGPDGIRNAVRSTKPTYLLLVGRTTYDYLNYEGQNIDPLCPAYLVSTSFWAQTTSDSAFGDLGRGYPEVAVGRLPVNNSTELSGAISHIVSYKGIPQSGIRLHAVADKADPLVADFGAQLDTEIKSKNPGISWQENYLALTYQTAPEVTAALKDAANGGADLIIYSGHGNAARLGAVDPRILDQTSVQSWTGNTVFLQSTCTANWMAKNVDGYKSIAIQALTQTQGGISASIGTSTYMNSDVATAFMNQLLKNTNGFGARWGSVLMKTQQWAGSQPGNAFYKDLMTTEQLFGDPAMPVYTPQSSTLSSSASPNAAGTF